MPCATAYWSTPTIWRVCAPGSRTAMRNRPHPQGPLRRPLCINRRTFLQALAGLTAAVGIFSPLTPLGAAMPTSAAGRP
ncbi:twin-arginine translocation signal domain-containing protein, partial [Serratia marcescens]